MLSRLFCCTTLTVLILFSFPVRVIAKSDLHDRPKIGVVLSGGGARGGAHIGVLKVLEAYRVPIDVIVGTSFGAFVGGLYASGLTPDQIEQLVLNADLETKFVSNIPRNALSIRRKQDDEQLFVKYRLGIKDGKLQFPRGIISGQELRLWLDEVLFEVRGVDNFDDLPIPFRCVATDIASGEEIIMGKGVLTTAIYISMTVPGVLPPVEKDGRLLVDGGLVNNLPINVARDLGAELIIAVDIGTPFATLDELDSALSILNHVPRLLVRGNTEKSLNTLRNQDILIQPNLGTLSNRSFARLDEAIAAGTETTRKLSGKLKALSLDEPQYAQHLDSRPQPYSERPVVEFVKVETNSNYREAYLRTLLRLQPGDVLDPVELETDLQKIYALGAFESIDYSIVEEYGQTGVVINTTEKRTGRNFLRFGFGIEDDFDNLSTYTSAVSYTMTQLNPLGAEWRSELRVGNIRRVFSEFYQPLGTGSQFFVTPFAQWQQRRNQLFDGDGEVIGSAQITDLEAGAGVGRTFGNWGQFELAYAHGVSDVDFDVFDVLGLFESGKADLGALTASFAVDTLDSLDFPHDGVSALVGWRAGREALGEDDNNDIAVIDGFHANTWGRNTFSFWLTAASTLDDESPVRNELDVGGFLDLSGFQTNELSGNHVGVARGIYYRRIRGGPLAHLINVPVYLGGSLELGNAWRNSDDISFSNALLAGSAFLGADTFIGPVFLGAGYAEGGNAAAYLFVGRPFSTELSSSVR